MASKYQCSACFLSHRKLTALTPAPGEVVGILGISSDRDDRRIFWCLNFFIYYYYFFFLGGGGGGGGGGEVA